MSDTNISITGNLAIATILIKSDSAQVHSIPRALPIPVIVPLTLEKLLLDNGKVSTDFNSEQTTSLTRLVYAFNNSVKSNIMQYTCTLEMSGNISVWYNSQLALLNKSKNASTKCDVHYKDELNEVIYIDVFENSTKLSEHIANYGTSEFGAGGYAVWSNSSMLMSPGSEVDIVTVNICMNFIGYGMKFDILYDWLVDITDHRLVVGVTNGVLTEYTGIAVVYDTHLDNVNSALKAFEYDVQFTGQYDSWIVPPSVEVPLVIVGTYTGNEIDTLGGERIPVAFTATVSISGEITFTGGYDWPMQISKIEIFGNKILALVNYRNNAITSIPWVFQHLNGDYVDVPTNLNLGNILSVDGYFSAFVFDTSNSTFTNIFVYTGLEANWSKLENYYDNVKQFPNYQLKSKNVLTLSKQLVNDKFTKS